MLCSYQIITEVRNQTDQLLDELDLGNIDLSDVIPDNLGPLLNSALSEIQLQQIDFATLEMLVRR